MSPALWDGRSIGVGEARPYNPIELTTGNIMRLLKASVAAGSAIGRSLRHPLRYGAAITFGWGDTFPGVEFPGAHVVHDHEMLASRGDPFVIDPNEFPPATAFPNRPGMPGEPYELVEPHVRYLRAAATQTAITVGDERQLVIVTGMEPDSGARYTQQISALPINDVVPVGQVSHFALGNTGYEMLTRTRQVTVYPG